MLPLAQGVSYQNFRKFNWKRRGAIRHHAPPRFSSGANFEPAVSLNVAGNLVGQLGCWIPLCGLLPLPSAFHDFLHQQHGVEP